MNLRNLFFGSISILYASLSQADSFDVKREFSFIRSTTSISTSVAYTPNIAKWFELPLGLSLKSSGDWESHSERVLLVTYPKFVLGGGQVSFLLGGEIGFDIASFQTTNGVDLDVATERDSQWFKLNNLSRWTLGFRYHLSDAIQIDTEFIGTDIWNGQPVSGLLTLKFML